MYDENCNSDNRQVCKAPQQVMDYKKEYEKRTDVIIKLQGENEEVRKINSVLRTEIENLKIAIINLVLKLH
jgi:hypothetical protein